MLILAMVLVSLEREAHAAPHPGTATSALVEPHRGHYLARQGFTMSFPNDWVLNSDQNNPDTLFDIDLKFQSPLITDAVLSLKASPVEKKTTLQKYVRKWIRDYQHYGFEILGTKVIKHKGKKGFLVDLYHKEKSIQSRQALFMQGPSPIVITCLGPSESFSKIISACDQSIVSLSWVNTPTIDAPKR